MGCGCAIGNVFIPMPMFMFMPMFIFMDMSMSAMTGDCRFILLLSGRPVDGELEEEEVGRQGTK